MLVLPIFFLVMSEQLGDLGKTNIQLVFKSSLRIIMWLLACTKPVCGGWKLSGLVGMMALLRTAPNTRSTKVPRESSGETLRILVNFP